MKEISWNKFAEVVNLVRSLPNMSGTTAKEIAAVIETERSNWPVTATVEEIADLVIMGM